MALEITKSCLARMPGEQDNLIKLIFYLNYGKLINFLKFIIKKDRELLIRIMFDIIEEEVVVTVKYL